MRDKGPVRLRRVVSGAAACLVVLTACAASAQTDNKAIAESLFEEGRKLMGQQKYHQACRKFEASMRLDPAAGTQLNMAVCHEKEGKIATAWSEFQDATVAARREGRADRAAFAQQHVKALEPQLPKLVLVVPKASRIPKLEIFGGGTPLLSAVWGTRVPINPGPETIEAHAPGYKPWKKEFKFVKGQVTKVVVPRLEKAPAAPSKPVVTAPTPVHEKRPPPPFWTTERTLGAVLGGVGVVGIGVGSYFGATAISKHKQSNSYCGDTTCKSQIGVDLTNDAKKNARLSDIAMGVGAVAVVTGAVLMITGGTSTTDGEMKSGKAAPLHLEVGMGPQAASVGMTGAW